MQDRCLLKECKALIKQLNSELNSSVQTLNHKQQMIVSLKQERERIQNGLIQQKQKNCSLVTSLESEVKENLILKQKVTQILLVNKQKDDTIDKFKDQLNESHKQNKKLMKECQLSKTNNEQRLQKIKVMEETIQLLMTENSQLKIDLQNKENQTKWEIQELKEINQQIKSKFKYDLTEQSTFTLQDISPRKIQKSVSTDKKKQKNKIYLTDQKPFFTRDVSRRYQNCETIKPFNIRKENPQLGEQIKSIKKQIASQYTLIQLKKQGYSKERVNKTLNQLKKKMSKMVQHAEKTDSQSCFD